MSNKVLNCNVRPTTDTLFFVRDDNIAVKLSEFGGAAMFGMGLHKMDEFRIVGRSRCDLTTSQIDDRQLYIYNNLKNSRNKQIRAVFNKVSEYIYVHLFQFCHVNRIL